PFARFVAILVFQPAIGIDDLHAMNQLFHVVLASDRRSRRHRRLRGSRKEYGEQTGEQERKRQEASLIHDSSYFAPAAFTAAGCGTFLVPASSAAVWVMLRVENARKKPQQVAVGGAGGVAACPAGCSGQLPYFSFICGSTASTKA